MGRDLTLYPEKASRAELKIYLENLGFVKCKHFWDWPKGTLNYSWFDHEDFKSIDGVSADVYPVSEEKERVTKNDWALHVRNVYSASWHDVKMLNDVLRGARKRFGGVIHGDYGKNRYAPLWEDQSTPMSRGISAIYSHIKSEMSRVRYALPNPSIEHQPKTGEKIDDFLEFTQSLDPSRVIYNGLVPFAVSMFEYFFSQVFEVLIKYDSDALEKRKSYKNKVDFDTLIELQSENISIENIISRNYTFQNLSQLNKAYKDWLDIDVRKILFKKKRIGNSIGFLEHRISEIIQYRHGIVHHFAIDRSLTKEGYIGILEAIEKGMDEFIKFIETKYSFKVDEHY